MTRSASRRTFLKTSTAASLALTAAAFRRRLALADDSPPFDPGGRVRVDYDETLSYNELYDNPPMLGRSEAWSQRVMSIAGSNANGDVVDYVHYSDVIPIYGAVHAEPPAIYPQNDIWFDVGNGYIHSSWIVPCKEEFQEPEEVIKEDIFWGEITVPTSWQHWSPLLRSKRYYDMAYGAVFRVLDRAEEEDGRTWYRIRSDMTPGVGWWVQATHVRRIKTREFAPISKNIPHDKKHIVVNLSEQMLTCYEVDQPVFTTRVSTGATWYDSQGNPMDFHTPTGTHFVIAKTPSRQMVGGEDVGDEYDLPGVPWCTYITDTGVAIHGTYWHNDYGRRRSHGCINVTPDAAQWIYRWVTPVTSHLFTKMWIPRDDWVEATRVVVEY